MAEKGEKRILIVDDMMFTRMYVKGIFESFGYTNITEAGTSKEALLRLVKDSPDLIILDLNLPDCDDLSTLRMIYEINPNQDVIVSTAVNQYIVMNEAKNLGIRDYLIKPFTSEQFENSVKSILEEE